MIKSLYPKYRSWSKSGAVWIISDTHFDDQECHLINPYWPTPEDYMTLLRDWVHKNDTLVHLGDVGNPWYMTLLKCYKVLISGNHDRGASAYEPYFDEVYTGPLFIGERILLSHEPVYGVEWCLNIHGHNHNGEFCKRDSHINLAANVVHFCPFNLGDAIKEGMLSNCVGIHRYMIDKRKVLRNDSPEEV